MFGSNSIDCLVTRWRALIKRDKQQEIVLCTNTPLTDSTYLQDPGLHGERELKALLSSTMALPSAPEGLGEGFCLHWSQEQHYLHCSQVPAAELLLCLSLVCAQDKHRALQGNLPSAAFLQPRIPAFPMQQLHQCSPSSLAATTLPSCLCPGDQGCAEGESLAAQEKAAAQIWMLNSPTCTGMSFSFHLPGSAAVIQSLLVWGIENGWLKVFHSRVPGLAWILSVTGVLKKYKIKNQESETNTWHGGKQHWEFFWERGAAGKQEEHVSPHTRYCFQLFSNEG